MSHKAVLTWQASTDVVDGYNVYRGTNPPGNEASKPLNASPIVELTFVDTTVQVGVAYDYVVTALKNGSESLHSNEFITPVILPEAPTNLVAVIS